MKELKALREGWDEAQIEEAKVSQVLTVQESVRQFLILYRSFAPHLQETESLFGPEREAYLVELQQRLQQVAQWRRDQSGESLSKRDATPGTDE